MSGGQIQYRNTAGSRRAPGIQSLVFLNELIHQFDIPTDDIPVPLLDGFPVLQGNDGEDLARSRGTNRCIVLELKKFIEELRIAADDPADAEAGQGEGFRHAGEGKCINAQGCGTRQPVGRILLKAPVHLVGKQYDTVQIAEPR